MEEQTNSPPVGRPIRPLALAAGLFLGAVAAVVVVLVVAAVWRSATDRLPVLTRENYEQALQLWQKNGPADYDLDLSVEGRRAGTIHVEIRGGEVTAMIRDGVAPRERRTWHYWSIPGQFETIGEELDKQADPVAGFHAPAGSRVILQAAFDPRLGYPLRYRRAILGTEFDIEWKITRFVPR